MSRTRIVATITLAVPLTLGMLLAGTASLGAEPAARRTASSRWAPLLKPGDTAPDFTLRRLHVEKADDGRWAARLGDAGDAVRLSAYRGKRPVCLFFSSYT